MARHFSPNDFFRQIPNTLLVRYFYDRGLFDNLDFSAMKETQPNALWKNPKMALSSLSYLSRLDSQSFRGYRTERDERAKGY